ncbi:MAG: EAL domain-containing protein [Gammaproteobacteria bacterium]|nr:EAL domain-containing protein [Gammaproteobacteria bacterium]
MAETSDSAVRQQESTSAGEALGLDFADYPLSPEVSEQRQQLRALFRQAPLGISTVVLLAVGLTAVLWGHVPDYILLPWLAFIGLNNALHVVTLHEYSRQEKRLTAITSWTRYQTLLAGASALGWGAGFILMAPHMAMEQQIFYLMLLCLLGTVHLPVLAPVFQSYVAFVLLSALPALAGLLFATETVSPYWITGTILVSAGLLLAARNYSAVLQHAFGLASNARQQAESLYETNERNRLANMQLKKAVHDQEQNGRRLSAEKLSTELTLGSIKEAVITVDLNDNIVYMNTLAEKYTGWHASAANGRPVTDVIRIIDEQNRIRIDDPVNRCLQGRTTITGDDHSILVRRDGLEYGIEFDTSPLRDPQGQMHGAVLVFRDVTQSRNQVRTLSWQASHDPLTGLINRREFEQRMDKLLETSPTNSRQHALCFIDLDNFKLINDTCGHNAGDKLLKTIAAQLRDKIRDTDTLARIGGDEFGLILYSCDLERANIIGETLRKVLVDIHFQWEGYEFGISGSIGIVAVNSQTTELESAMRNADLACYRAKEKGGDAVVIHEADSSEVMGGQAEMRYIESVMESINNRHFKLYSQPIQPLDDFNPINMSEVLLRVCDTEDRVIMPRRFLNIAQRYHLLPQIDLAVLENVFGYLQNDHSSLQSSARITINISAQTANDPRSVNRIADLLQDNQGLAERICFELGERALVSEPGHSKQLLELLRRYGSRIAIDDFSFSLGVFRYLNTLNLDYIKIDARQMQDPDPRSLDYTLIEAINLLSHRIGAQTIVKSVSDQEILDALDEIGVDYVQGYIVGRPELVSEKIETQKHQADAG